MKRIKLTQKAYAALCKRCKLIAKTGQVPSVGSPKTINHAHVRNLYDKGIKPAEIAKAMRIGRASVYRILAE